MTTQPRLDRPSVQYGLLILALLVLHFPQSSTFVWDDVLLVGSNPWQFEEWALLWQQSLWTGIPGEHTQQWYRPLMATHLLLDKWLFEDSITGRQWLNVAWFATALFLLRIWGHRKLSMSSQQTFWMALLLICHPFSLELTQFIAARNDTMVLAFALGFGLSLKQIPSMLSIGLAVLWAFLALTSKESAVFWLGMIVWVQWEEAKRYWFSVGIAILGWLGLKSLSNLSEIVTNIEWIDTATTFMDCGVWFVTHFSPLAVPTTPPVLSLLSVALLTLMICTSNTRIRRLGTVLLFLGGLLASLSIQQSHSLGFRYAWIPLLGQIIWIVSMDHKTKTLLQMSCAFGFIVLNTQLKSMWENNTIFWDSNHAYHPTQHTACGAFMNHRPSPETALPLLYQSLQNPPMHHCCAQATRYPIELNDAQRAIELGTLALQNGCPNIPELHSPLALAYALEGDWTLAIEHITQIKQDPFGYKAIIEVALGLRNQDESALEKWARPQSPQHPEWGVKERKQALKQQAQFLLEQSNQSKESR